MFPCSRGHIECCHFYSELLENGLVLLKITCVLLRTMKPSLQYCACTFTKDSMHNGTFATNSGTRGRVG